MDGIIRQDIRTIWPNPMLSLLPEITYRMNLEELQMKNQSSIKYDQVIIRQKQFRKSLNILQHFKVKYFRKKILLSKDPLGSLVQIWNDFSHHDFLLTIWHKSILITLNGSTQIFVNVYLFVQFLYKSGPQYSTFEKVFVYLLYICTPVWAHIWQCNSNWNSEQESGIHCPLDTMDGTRTYFPFF